MADTNTPYQLCTDRCQTYRQMPNDVTFGNGYLMYVNKEVNSCISCLVNITVFLWYFGVDLNVKYNQGYMGMRKTRFQCKYHT